MKEALEVARRAASWAVRRYSLNNSWAEDIAQEVLLKHWGANSTDPLDATRARALAQAAAWSTVRSEGRRERRQAARARCLADRDNSEIVAIRDEFGACLAWLLSRVSARHAQLLVARLCYEATYSEISSLSGLNPESARSQMYRVSRRLTQGGNL